MYAANLQNFALEKNVEHILDFTMYLIHSVDGYAGQFGNFCRFVIPFAHCVEVTLDFFVAIKKKRVVFENNGR